ncbi:MAG: response regulator transcription factor [Ethanoligenens sp.]|uniref:response regulator n=1 Tax=Ethanoligenens sp. TaxID=2099655 RepID=UPI0039E9F838
MTVLIVDDDPLVSMSLKTIVEADDDITVCGTGNCAAEAVRLYVQLHPDILLMDIRMGSETGLDAGKEILRNEADARILYLTTFADDDYIIEALRIGAKGYLLKQKFECIVPALKAVNAGQTVFGEDITARIPSYFGNVRPDFTAYGLTERESGLLEFIAEGLSNKEIATRVFLSEGTVRNCVSTMLEKLHLHGRTQLAVFYYKCGRGQ